MTSIVKCVIGVYIAIAIVTMGFQIYYRYPVCSITGECGLSMGKGVVWSAILPAYWTIQWNLFK
jgi:hypothetical protein